MSCGILAANGFEAWVTRIMWFYMSISTAVLMYVIWWYRAKLGSVIVHPFFIGVKSLECILKISVTIKATEYCWFLFSLLLTFSCVNLPNRKILSNRVESPVLLTDYQVNSRCFSGLSVWFSDYKVWSILGKKKRGIICQTPRGLTTRHAFILLMTHSIL